MNKGLTKYTPAGGTPSLKKAIVAKFKRENGLDYTEKQILVSCGGKQTSFNLCMALLNPGDEAIVPAPFWVSYPDMAQMADGKPGLHPRRHRARVQDHAAAARTRDHAAFTAHLDQQPSNPTGAVYTADELRGLGEVLRKHPNIVIATDDMYEHILLDGSKFVNILNVCPDSSQPHRDDERRLQGVLDDRLAHRLLRRPAGADRGDGERAVAQHLEPHVDLAVRGRGGAERRPVVHRPDGRWRSRSAASSWPKG
jgi:aspartate/methionine/tyrosine aminotransferase